MSLRKILMLIEALRGHRSGLNLLISSGKNAQKVLINGEIKMI